MKCLQVLAALFAILAGVSVTLQLGGTICLNGKSKPNRIDYNMMHALYVSQGGLLVGALWLSVLAFLAPSDVPRRPKRVWSVFGGIVTLPAFVTTPAAQVLGLQLVLMLLLLGMVGAALLFDLRRAKRLEGGHAGLGKLKAAGLLLIFAGVVIEVMDAVRYVEGSVAKVLIYMFSCFSVGVLYAVQSKMNLRLARDLGSSFRSAMWSNTSGFTIGVVLLLLVRFAFDVRYDVKSEQWWIWLLVGFQSAFYTIALTLLPKVMGYSATFVLVLAGKLGSSALADTLGAFQPAVSLSALRCASVCVMLVGAILYSLVGSASTPSVEPADENDDSENVVGSFCSANC